jgi:predicted ATP-grasp superfamily ATP-dependent carboligase
LANLAEHRVLLLDAHLRHSLAIARSLGRRGLEVVCAAPMARFPARYSRYVTSTVVFDPQVPRDSVTRFRSLIESEQIGVVIAGGLAGNEFLCRHRRELEPLVSAPFNNLDAFEVLSHKEATVHLAERLGVRYPLTVRVDGPADIDAIVERVGFPMVFKSPRDQGSVRYPRDREDLRRMTEEFARAHLAASEDRLLPIVQEYVDGEGYGFFGLSRGGVLAAYFMHRRVHEVPPSGGPSAMAMSHRDHVLRDLGSRFFEATQWTGVAMVEFKKSRKTGDYYLIEVNPKFWGSLDLSIAAGVDFPFLLYQLLTGVPIETTPGDYRDGVLFRWLTMDLAYAMASRHLRGYVRAFADPRIIDDFDGRDVLPTIALFARSTTKLLDVVRGQGKTISRKDDGRCHRTSLPIER